MRQIVGQIISTIDRISVLKIEEQNYIHKSKWRSMNEISFWDKKNYKLSQKLPFAYLVI